MGLGAFRLTDRLVVHRRDTPVRATALLTLTLVVGLILLGAVLHVLGFFPLDPVSLSLRNLVGGPLRRRVLSPTTVARRIGVRAGMRVLLFASDNGKTANAIAREVGSTGQVESVLSNRDSTRRASEILANSGVINVNIVTAQPQRVPFGDASFDAVCLGCAFDRAVQPGEILAEAWRVLRPAGRLSASATVGDTAFRWRRTIEKWGEGAGFESLEYFGNLLAYTVNFRKPMFT